ncbi:MAG: hypothetical protein EZS28_026277 [Streblomastix strix]|uniref:RRM domain-containing protein n=1 Tax=Streblomastix strix TaxID=222440 RepID=A0A5J4V653_9EUKA|nr:MAG: hypothetical protein EZS28_026277 [Streblomastix strix]
MATVEFSSQDIAILASKFANGQYLKGNLISSEISTVPQVNKWVTPQDGNSLKINNNAAQPLVDNKFNPISTSIPPNQPPNQQIHGFVNFSNEYDAQNALQSLRRSEIDGRRVKIIFKKLSNNRNNRSRINKKTLGNKIDEKQPQDVEQDDQSSSNSEDDNIIPVQVPQIQHQFVFPSLPEQLIIPPSVYKQMIIPVPQPIPKPEPEPEPELDNRFTINEQLDIGQIKDVTGLDQDAAINLYQRFGKNAQFAINFHLDHTF